MSDSPANNQETVYLLPNQIITSPRFNVRPFSSESNEIEEKLIEKLAQAIESVGQLDALVITPDKVLIAGHRRRKAAIIINERRTARGASLLKLRCSIDATGGDLRRKSIISNIHRKANSAMDLAYLIAQIREENHWQARACTAKVAAYLGVDTATVYQHEKFLSVERELQNKIHDGTLSAYSALDLIKQLPSATERSAAVERAAEIQCEDKLEKTLNNYAAGRSTLEETTAALNKNPARRIEHPAIIKAIRERHTVSTKHAPKLALSRSELIQSIAQFDSADYPEPARDFARYWVNQHAIGVGTSEELRNKFRAVFQVPSNVTSKRRETLAS